MLSTWLFFGGLDEKMRSSLDIVKSLVGNRGCLLTRSIRKMI